MILINSGAVLFFRQSRFDSVFLLKAMALVGPA